MPTMPICFQHRPRTCPPLPAPRSVTCHAAQPPQERQVNFSYRSEDGRQKATMEDVFADAQPLPDDEINPWQFSWQMNERVLVWSDDLKQRLVKLAALLPPLQHKLSVIKPALLARLAANPTAVAEALLRLKTLFPEANAATMALRCPALVLGDVPMTDVEHSAGALRALLPNTRVDALVEEHPDAMLLDVEGLEDAMNRAQEVLPGVDVERMLAQDPSSVFSFQRGRRLVPYDPDTAE